MSNEIKEFSEQERAKIRTLIGNKNDNKTEIEASYGFYDRKSGWFIPGLSRNHTNNLHEFLNSDPNINKITQRCETVYIITSNEDIDVQNLRHIENYDPLNHQIISSYTQQKTKNNENNDNNKNNENNRLDLRDYGIRIKSSKEQTVHFPNFMKLWSKTINQVTKANKPNKPNKPMKVGLRRNKFRTSYTSIDKSAIYYGLSIDITHVIETEYYDDGHSLYSCRYEIELELESDLDLDLELDHGVNEIEKSRSGPNRVITALEDLYRVINYLKPQASSIQPTAAIYFGSFDPMHENHFLLAQRTIQNQHLDYLFFVPNTPNALKGKVYTDIQHRINMISLKIGQNKVIKLSSADKIRPVKGSMYVIDPEEINTDKIGRSNLIKFLETIYGIQIIYQITGSDSIRDTITRTRNSGYALIKNNKCKFIVYPRANDPPLNIPKELRDKIIVDNKHREEVVSSTFIRKNAHNKNIQIEDKIVDTSIKKYIQDHGLYKK